ncbi:hypothetical protein Tco_0986334 [Tanacetum coccineum]
MSYSNTNHQSSFDFPSLASLGHNDPETPYTASGFIGLADSDPCDVSIFIVGQTLRYSYNDAVSINRIDVIDVACDEYAQEVLGFADSSTSGNLTPSLDLILSTSSLSLTPFEEGDFILEEIEAFLTNDSIPLGIDLIRRETFFYSRSC